MNILLTLTLLSHVIIRDVFDFRHHRHTITYADGRVVVFVCELPTLK